MSIFHHSKVVCAVLAKQVDQCKLDPLVSVQVHQILELKGTGFHHWIQNMIPALRGLGLIYK